MASPCTPLFHSTTLCYYEQKINELRECFEATQKEFENQLRRLKLELQQLDDQSAELDQEEREQFEKTEQLRSVQDLWSIRQERYQKELQHLDQLKEQVLAKLREDCMTARQQLEEKIKVLPSGQRKVIPATVGIQSPDKNEVKIKADNKIILEKLIYVQSRIATLSMAPVGVPSKQAEVNDDQLTQLNKENWSLKEMIDILSQRLERKNNGCGSSTMHLDDLEQKFLQLLKNTTVEKHNH